MVKLFANSGDPDQMPHSAASDLGFHYLPVTSFRGLQTTIWVNPSRCKALCKIVTEDILIFLYARLKNGTYYVIGYGVRPSVNFFVSG